MYDRFTKMKACINSTFMNKQQISKYTNISILINNRFRVYLLITEILQY